MNEDVVAFDMYGRPLKLGDYVLHINTSRARYNCRVYIITENENDKSDYSVYASNYSLTPIVNSTPSLTHAFFKGTSLTDYVLIEPLSEESLALAKMLTGNNSIPVWSFRLEFEGIKELYK